MGRHWMSYRDRLAWVRAHKDTAPLSVLARKAVEAGVYAPSTRVHGAVKGLTRILAYLDRERDSRASNRP